MDYLDMANIVLIGGVVGVSLLEIKYQYYDKKKNYVEIPSEIIQNISDNYHPNLPKEDIKKLYSELIYCIYLKDHVRATSKSDIDLRNKIKDNNLELLIVKEEEYLDKGKKRKPWAELSEISRRHNKSKSSVNYRL